ncbi:MAG: diaminopimelate dehydrogenase [Sporomusaceae bacterium]|jgi:diaminopimelate dehydrogenase|nr:diaminopimelate dehydrogenase [Sporomusaceae bacterium]
MKQKIRIGIVGYGNLGKGAEKAVRQNPDMELVAVFSRRALSGTESKVPALSITQAADYQDKIDVMLLCGGSLTDLAEQGPQFAALFNTVDSFDTHAKIPEYYQKMDAVARGAGKLAAISVGWDPGLFSLNRLLAGAVLPDGKDYTFWGKGVSQGHSDAIRRVAGVKNACQYTIPYEESVNAVRAGADPVSDAKKLHWRDCYVVAADGADPAAIEQEIKTMPNYFDGYKTEVTFLTEAEFKQHHTNIPHGGFIFRSGATNNGQNKHIIEFALKLDSNPEFTSSVLTAYARAVYRLAQTGQTGAVTVFDIPFGLLSPEDPAELRRKLL